MRMEVMRLEIMKILTKLKIMRLEIMRLDLMRFESFGGSLRNPGGCWGSPGSSLGSGWLGWAGQAV
jgi:hypothetical protein